MRFALILLLFVSGLFIQESLANDHHKKILLINTAKWCPACQKNGERIGKEVVPKVMEFPEVTIVINDLSDDETKKKSALQLEKLNLLDFSEKNKTTGVIYLIDEVTHKEITNIEVSKTTDDIVNELTKKIKTH